MSFITLLTSNDVENIEHSVGPYKLKNLNFGGLTLASFSPPVANSTKVSKPSNSTNCLATCVVINPCVILFLL